MVQGDARSLERDSALLALGFVSRGIDVDVSCDPATRTAEVTGVPSRTRVIAVTPQVRDDLVHVYGYRPTPSM
jgi:hypothetical protein